MKTEMHLIFVRVSLKQPIAPPWGNSLSHCSEIVFMDMMDGYRSSGEICCFPENVDTKFLWHVYNQSTDLHGVKS
jgi:hypothetical protein